MDASGITKALQEKFGSSILEAKLDVHQPWVVVDAAKIVDISMFLRDDSRTRFDFLRSIAAVDYIAENIIEMVYLLFSYTHQHDFKVKVRLPRDNPRVQTVENVWPAANWHEREAFDLMGVEFENHSDLRRLLMPDDWVGFPLRKDYKEGEEYHGVSTTREYLTGMPQLPTHPSQRPTK